MASCGRASFFTCVFLCIALETNANYIDAELYTSSVASTPQASESSCLLQASHKSKTATAAHVEAFDTFIGTYQRSYSKGSDEYQKRLAYFSRRMDQAAKINAVPDQLWTAGASPLADFSKEELKEKIGWYGTANFGHEPSKSAFLNQVSAQPEKPKKLPDTVSWTHLESLKENMNQKSCGSCWAVASITVLKAHAEIYKSSQRSFSAEELVACVGNPRHCGGSGGCQGATVELAMNYTLWHGMNTEAEFPYNAHDESCKKHRKERGLTKFLAEVGGGVPKEDLNAKFEKPGKHSASAAAPGLYSIGMRGWEKLPVNKYEPLLRAVHERGPVAVSADASLWDLYAGGVFSACSPDSIVNHAITLVGYGQDKKLQGSPKYWLIQNSWGSNFGEDGRIRVLRHDDDEENCGVDSQPQEGTECADGPKKVKVCGKCGLLYDSVVPYFN
eukprot:TRINITY_DN50965_c0_g1_i1.p1 TRINITY_DN50965_c0_g1~~TRINITY_DN50965_c0_g1_i1.p1  ORF type:complete len:445 (+),score=92.41 TRINITY_DN50965_c0_g1_i1:97-1431(+)